MPNDIPKPTQRIQFSPFLPGESTARILDSSGCVIVNVLKRLVHKFEPSDLLLLIYVWVILREFFWVVGSNVVASVLTSVCAGVICSLHAIFREERKRGASMVFLPVVALPLFLMFAMRSAYPDFSFDVLNYHIVNAERALRGWPSILGDFFPSILPVNPAPDMVLGVSRHVLGYRLGTLPNYLAVLWAGLVVERMLRPLVKNRWLRHGCVLVTVSTEYIPYLFNFYMVDVLAFPLLMEATEIALGFPQLRKKSYSLIHLSLFLGISLAFKLINLAFVIPILLVFVCFAFPYRQEIGLAALAIAAVVFVAPSVPFCLYIYGQTGSPLFPYYNAVFRSPFATAQNYKDTDHGPVAFWQVPVWPIVGFFYPHKIGALSRPFAVYTGRISIAFLAAGFGLLTGVTGRKVKALCIMVILGSILWSLSAGEVRYAVYLESLGAFAIIGVLHALFFSDERRASGPEARKITAFIVLFGALLVVQTAFAYRSAYLNHEALFKQEIQPTVFSNYGRFFSESRYWLRDRSEQEFLSPQEKDLYGGVEVWINSYGATSGVEVLLNGNAPIVSVVNFVDVIDYLETEASRQRLAATLASLKGKRMFSLSYPSYFPESISFITRTGLTVGKMTPVEVPFLSKNIRLKMLLIEVLPPGDGMGREQAQAEGDAILKDLGWH
jgi:hypothetical protein